MKILSFLCGISKKYRQKENCRKIRKKFTRSRQQHHLSSPTIAKNDPIGTQTNFNKIGEAILEKINYKHKQTGILYIKIFCLS